ncbi:MAG: sensor histidine kinase [Candidatus Binataceae bacterium]
MGSLSHNLHTRIALEKPVADAPYPDRWHRGLRLEALANLAHELRQPVQALLGYLEILSDELGDSIPAGQRRILARMNLNAHELALTVENVMDFATAGAGAEVCAAEDIELRDLLAEIVPSLEAANQGKGLALHIDLETAPVVFHAPRRPIKSILLNLALNAIKFTDRGAVTIAIRRAPAETGSAIELEVSDTGPGIEPSKVARAFEQCTQLSAASARTHRGMGLGLAVVRRNADRIGARLFVRTTRGGDPAFRLLIPIAPPSSGRAKGSRNAAAATAAACHRHR